VISQLAVNAAAGKREEARCRGLFEQAGLKVWKFSQARATWQTRGPSDLLCTDPQWSSPNPHGLAFWWEVKAGNAKPTKDQRLFREHMIAAGVRHYIGNYDDALELLVEFGYARKYPSSGLITINPRKIK
jgi:antibiotic biosynthesis monooxygenase (ABM) superfamily enzyme